MATFWLGKSRAAFLPVGDGTKIRGQRANYILADEFSSIDPEIYETVIAPFSSVSSAPVDNLINNAKLQAKKDLGLILDESNDYKGLGAGNQSILSGTASYSFKHFAHYWRRYKKIIESKGDWRILKEVVSEEDMDNGFDWRDYSIIRLPYTILPKGYLDAKVIARGKATMHVGIFQMEFLSKFTADSKGFFPRSLIEKCCAPLVAPNGESINFDAVTFGKQDRKYIYGIDPASEQDNFSIVILELCGSHRRIVYCWTMTRAKHVQAVQKQLTQENDFYGYCARKIRSLMVKFPCSAIALDSQGGGIAVMEALHNKNNLQEDERMIWPVIDYDKPKDSDMQPGLHIVHMINFADAAWTSGANHGMKKDFEDRLLVFPFFDNVEMAKAIENEMGMSKTSSLYDSLEDVMFEIEELKDELTQITHTQTPGTNRDKWDTPEIKVEGGKKGRLRKDRYSALLMANMVARTAELNEMFTFKPNMNAGGLAQRSKGYKGGALYSGPQWFTEQMKELDAHKMHVYHK